MNTIKCAMPRTQKIRKCSHNVIILVHTLPFIAITVYQKTIHTMEKYIWHEVRLLFFVYNFCSRHSSYIYSVSYKNPDLHVRSVTVVKF
jgi:hypothetical protein